MKKKLRYSDIIGSYFYHIGLTSDDRDLVDVFFTAAAHHLKRFQEATIQEHRYFHLSLHRGHLRKMMNIIFERGDFSKAKDESNRDLNLRATWNPEWTTMPDPLMFRKMMPDWRYPVGVLHCADQYLHKDEIGEVELLEEISSAYSSVT